MSGGDPIARARAILAGSRRIVALTGSGISAESGVPTFRGPGGLWRSHRPEELATPEAFARDPRLVWEWYEWRREIVARARPNPGHRALVALERRAPGFLLVTQNVDGLHADAGSTRPIELHGSLWTLRCTSCGRERRDRTVPLAELPPRCACGGVERPGVVWFGEPLPPDLLLEAMRAAAGSEVTLLIGTSAVVWPAAGLGEAALGAGAQVIEVNPEPTGYSDRVLSIRGPAGVVLPRLIEEIVPGGPGQARPEPASGPPATGAFH